MEGIAQNALEGKQILNKNTQDVYLHNCCHISLYECRRSHRHSTKLAVAKASTQYEQMYYVYYYIRGYKHGQNVTRYTHEDGN
jgi:hypothetical protein